VPILDHLEEFDLLGIRWMQGLNLLRCLFLHPLELQLVSNHLVQVLEFLMATYI
jgi:hypothetical protein